MKKALFLIFPVFIFIPAFLYLHQKVQLYVEAYRLSKNYEYHNELVDKRDYLMYNFSKEVSLEKVNQWAQLKEFAPVSKEKVIALNIQRDNHISLNSNKITVLLNRFIKASTSSSTALAEDN